MKTHRNILIISIIIIIISLPFLIILDKGKIYEITLALLTSATISFLLELPNYCSLKKDNRTKLYNALYSAKYHTSFFINDLEKLPSNIFSIDKTTYYFNLNNIGMDLNFFDSFDNDYYFLNRNKFKITKLKNTLRESYQNIKMSSDQLLIRINDLKIEKLQNGQQDIVFIYDLKDELDLIAKSCQNFLITIENFVPLVFSKSQLDDWINANASLENFILNLNISKK